MNHHEKMEARNVRSGLLADVTRCFGGGCADADHCLRYLGRNDNFPMLSYIQGDTFVEGVCIYRIAPNSQAERRRERGVE